MRRHSGRAADAGAKTGARDHEDAEGDEGEESDSDQFGRVEPSTSVVIMPRRIVMSVVGENIVMRVVAQKPVEPTVFHRNVVDRALVSPEGQRRIRLHRGRVDVSRRCTVVVRGRVDICRRWQQCR